MAPPIKYGLGYRSRTLTLTLTLTLKLTLTLTIKVTIMYAVQNDTEMKFNIVLYIKVIFVGKGVGMMI